MNVYSADHLFALLISEALSYASDIIDSALYSYQPPVIKCSLQLHNTLNRLEKPRL